MDIFDLSTKKFEQEIQEVVNNHTPEELLTELEQCGYKNKQGRDVIITDKEKFKLLLENKEEYKCFVDNDSVWFCKKEDIEKYSDYNNPPPDIEFSSFGYELLNEVFNALGIESELV